MFHNENKIIEIIEWMKQLKNRLGSSEERINELEVK